MDGWMDGWEKIDGCVWIDDGWMDGKTDGRMKETEGWMVRSFDVCVWMDGQMDGINIWMVGLIDGCIDGWNVLY